MSNKEDLLFSIISEYEKMIETKTFSSSFKELYSTLQKNYRDFECMTFVDFLLLLEKPIQEICIFKPSTLKKYLRDVSHYPIVKNGRITEPFETFLYEDNLDNFQEKRMLNILTFCKEHKLQDLYVSLRRMVIEHPFISGEDYLAYVDRLSFQYPEHWETFLEPLLKDFYEPYTEKAATLCKHCKYPMERNENGEYKCVKHMICQHYTKGIPDEHVVKTQRHAYKILQKGLYLFVTIPGLFELKIFEKFNKNDAYDALLFDNFERNGDVSVICKKSKRRYDIDCKVHTIPEFLYQCLKKDKKAKNMFIVVPSFLWKEQKEILKTLDSQNEFTFMSEHAITRYINKMEGIQ